MAAKAAKAAVRAVSRHSSALGPEQDSAQDGTSVDDVSAVGQILRSINQGQPMDQVMGPIAALIEARIAGSVAAVLLLDPDGLGVSVTAAPSVPTLFRLAIQRQAIGAQLAAAGPAEYERRLVTTDIRTDPSWQQGREAAAAEGLVCSWTVTFVGANEQVLGYFALYFTSPRTPEPAERQALGDIAQLAAAAVQQTGGRHLLHDRTRSNALTGLPNRAVLLERLRMAQLRVGRSSSFFAVIQVAIEGIAQLNSTLGPAAGDEVLRLAAQRLVNVAGTSATVAHVWGVEFAVLIEDLPDGGAATIVAARLREACREPFDVEGLAVSVGATIGVAAYSSVTATDAMPEEEPLRAATAAKEEARLRGSDRIGVYDPVTGPDAVTLAPELRRGIDENELSMAYQPIVDLATATTRRYEALMRWTNPRRGIVSPETFVPVAEQTGLVADLGRYALREGLAELARLRESDSSLGISVNVSVRQLADEKLPILLADLLAEHGLPRASVTLEVTEGVLLGSGAAGWRVLAGLREIGARIALDDFGTGFSQLSYLRQFWFDEIKIDRSFVASMMGEVAARAIIVAVIALAEYTGSEVVAEGVEHEDQRAMLLELGCTHGQGYLFGAPGPTR
jgi:diguanylate cyclase (GGDEF)-like protein